MPCAIGCCTLWVEWGESGQWMCDIYKCHLISSQDELRKATGEIARMPPLVFAGECRTLQDRLAKCVSGEAFLLQGGDCAESFDMFSANR